MKKGNFRFDVFAIGFEHYYEHCSADLEVIVSSTWDMAKKGYKKKVG